MANFTIKLINRNNMTKKTINIQTELVEKHQQILSSTLEQYAAKNEQVFVATHGIDFNPAELNKHYKTVIVYSDLSRSPLNIDLSGFEGNIHCIGSNANLVLGSVNDITADNFLPDADPSLQDRSFKVTADKVKKLSINGTALLQLDIKSAEHVGLCQNVKFTGKIGEVTDLLAVCLNACLENMTINKAYNVRTDTGGRLKNVTINTVSGCFKANSNAALENVHVNRSANESISVSVALSNSTINGSPMKNTRFSLFNRLK